MDVCTIGGPADAAGRAFSCEEATFAAQAARSRGPAVHAPRRGPRLNALGRALLVCAMGLARFAFAAEGTQALGVGAIQQGLAGAGVAAPQDASWIRMNPAAIVDLERRIDLGLELYRIEAAADPTGPLLAGAPEDLGPVVVSLVNPLAGEMHDTSFLLSPSAAAVFPWGDHAFGLGVFGVRGSRVDYPKARTLAGLRFGGDRRTRLEVAEAPFAWAYRFENGWAVGASIVAVGARLRSDSMTRRLTVARAEYAGDNAYGAGFRLGVYKRWDAWSIGLCYSSRQWMQRFDDYGDLMRFSFDHPQTVQAGVAWRPHPKWEVMADYRFIDWSGVPQLSRPTIEAGLGWVDQHIGKLALQYALSDEWTLRMGVSYGKSPVPDHEVFSNVMFPANSEAHASLGATWRFAARQELHCAYQHAFEKRLEDNGRGDLFSLGGGGTTTRLAQHAFSMQYTWRF